MKGRIKEILYGFIFFAMITMVIIWGSTGPTFMYAMF